ncbi:MAG TPA: glycosyltransferase, partial [Terriglobales bacterium]|nr:glycosyltransferase [Terriglobales bacterium]
VSSPVGAWCKRVAQRVYRNADRVICISERVRERVLEGSQANAVVVYNGVDSERFRPATENSDCLTVLSVGNLIPIKGHELLLRGLAAVQDRFPQISCQIIGDGPERHPLQSLARELGLAEKVTFLGRIDRDKLSAAMRSCAIFALPSRYEGLGCVYLEAMACEKPVIACHNQGIEEIVKHKRNGWLINPDDLSQMTEALSTLLQEAHTRKQIGESARKTILAGLTYAHQSENLAKLYRACLR